MTTVETRVVDPVTNRASMEAVNVTETEIVETNFYHEEEKMIADEEIDSCEGEDLENQMLTVALVKSVVDSSSNHNAEMPESPRYGLRKRRRPCDTTSSDAEGADPKKTASSIPVNEDPEAAREVGVVVKGEVKEKQHVEEPPGSYASSNFVKQEETHEAVVGTRIGDPGGSNGVNTEISIKPKGESLQPPAQTLPAHQAAAPVTDQAIAPVKIERKAARKSSRRQRKATSKTVKPLKEERHVPIASAVPNPLSQSTPSPPKAQTHPYLAQTHGSNVPCPLVASVPCPLQPDNSAAATDKRVTISEPPPPTTRNRIFSVDLDRELYRMREQLDPQIAKMKTHIYFSLCCEASAFDFSDMGGDHTDVAPESTELPVLPRNRAFSFEFFNFVGDELLSSAPGPCATSSELPDPTINSDTDDMHIIRRPRGDSIIFDPMSFQDGGIHETNALLKVKASRESAPELLADSRLATVPETRLPKPAPNTTNTPNPLPPYNAGVSQPNSEGGKVATLPSALNSSPSNVSSPATFQMELLNKDGRIGIYLPEARKARIARFHAKRKMRIWRKRIKYDCRKKLADSRPRIKGRFVKRSDMEE